LSLPEHGLYLRKFRSEIGCIHGKCVHTVRITVFSVAMASVGLKSSGIRVKASADV
jgi:hypothetical protein